MSLIDAELNQRYPGRETIFAVVSSDADGFREAMRVLDEAWPTTIERLRNLPPDKLHERVDEQWSPIENLRHLVFAIDAWANRALLGDPSPYDALDLPHTEMGEVEGVPNDPRRPPVPRRGAGPARRPHGLRARGDREPHRRAAGGDHRADPRPGYPESEPYQVRRCLGAILIEEWEHHLFIKRDLAVPEARRATRTSTPSTLRRGGRDDDVLGLRRGGRERQPAAHRPAGVTALSQTERGRCLHVDHIDRRSKHVQHDTDPKAEITGLYGYLMKRFSRKMFGDVPEPAEVMWHNRAVLTSSMGFGRKAQKWDQLDPNLKSFAHMAVASLVGCSWCLDLNYFQAHNEGLDEAKASEVPRWRESTVFTPLERDVMEYAEAMTETPPRVTDELFARLLEQLGAPAMVELTAWSGSQT